MSKNKRNPINARSSLVSLNAPVLTPLIFELIPQPTPKQSANSFNDSRSLGPKRKNPKFILSTSERVAVREKTAILGKHTARGKDYHLSYSEIKRNRSKEKHQPPSTAKERLFSFNENQFQEMNVNGVVQTVNNAATIEEEKFTTNTTSSVNESFW